MSIDGINSGAPSRIPGPLGLNPAACAPVAGGSAGPVGGHQDPLLRATVSERLKRRMSKRSARYKGRHKHEKNDPDRAHADPFKVTPLNPQTSASLMKKENRWGLEFVTMNLGAEIEVLIDDHPNDNFLLRRFLTPHLAQGGGHIEVSGLEPNFARRTIGPFIVKAKSVGLVQILALDALGRCRGELVISVKPAVTHRIRFVRVHNGSASAKTNLTKTTEAKVEAMLAKVNPIFQSQTGIRFVKDGPLVDQLIADDLSNGLPEPVWKARFFAPAQQPAPFMVFLFERLKKPFIGTNKIEAVSSAGRFHHQSAASIAWTDEADAHGWGAFVLAHEIAHCFIPQSRWSDLDFDPGGHSQFHRGLMTPKPQVGDLSWREVCVIQPNGLGPGGLQALIANGHLWPRS